MRVSILRVVNSLLAAIDRAAGVPGQQLYFSIKVYYMQLNSLFLGSGFRGMLEGKDYRAVDIIFSIIAAHIDRATETQNEPN